MCDKIANTHSSTMQFVPECYKTQEMRDKDFNKHFIGFFYIFDQWKTQEIRDKSISDYPFFKRLNKSVMKLLMIVYSCIKICPWLVCYK